MKALMKISDLRVKTFLQVLIQRQMRLFRWHLPSCIIIMLVVPGEWREEGE